MRAQKKVKPLSFSAAQSSDKITPVMSFLKDNYAIEVNRYDPNTIRIRSLKKIYQFPVSLDDISLHMMQEGISHTRQMIQMILRSPNQMRTYDPIAEYFERVEKIELKESHIDKLIAHLRVREFGDRPDGYYHERASRYIRKWLVATVACATGRYANEAALIFVSEAGGNGKTTLAKFLCPPALEDMMATSSKDTATFNLDQAMVRNFFVFYDEMRGLTASSAEDFKMLMSAEKLAVRLKGDLCPIPRRRIASVIGTTNNCTGNRHGFLFPTIGTRRFICIHVDSIDFNYINEVDIDAVWAEAAQLMHNPDYEYKLTQEDYDELDNVNQRYIIDTPASVLIQQVFSIPDGSDPESEQWLTPTEIVAELQKHRLIKPDIARHVTPWHVGAALRALGYTQKMIYGQGERLYKYLVKNIISHE